MKKLLVSGVILITLIILVPSLLVLGFSREDPVLIHSAKSINSSSADKGAQDGKIVAEQPVVSVFRSEQEKIEEVLFEDYIVGVVAREMPASFQLEALKAQALTARTYILNLLLFGGGMKTPEGADVTDTVDHQVYSNDEELRLQWGDDYEWKIARVRQAVYETSGSIITYADRPINATFFSTSNGYTENSEEYWKNEIPYLRSVESPWDIESPRYKGEKQFTIAEVENRLDVSMSDGGIKVLSRTTGGRVHKLSIGGKEQTIGGEELNGRYVREMLDLDSADFTFHIAGDTVSIETFGWGHGVGMSQYGANGMAQEGYNYQEIIAHYYDGVEIGEAERFLGEISFAKDSDGQVEKEQSLASHIDTSSATGKHNE